MGDSINYKVPCWFGCKRKSDNPDCRKTCHLYLHMNYFITNCGMPDADRYLKVLQPSEADIEAFQRLEELRSNIKSFVEDGKTLYIGSLETETGKTTWSIKLMYRYFYEIWSGSDFRPRGFFLYVPEFLQKIKLNEFKNSFEFKELDSILNNADVVIWDDITNQKLTDYEQNFLNTYITRRIQRGKANIFNGMIPEDFEQSLGNILASRIKKSELIALNG